MNNHHNKEPKRTKETLHSTIANNSDIFATKILQLQDYNILILKYK
jgi:hypothetical protein